MDDIVNYKHTKEEIENLFEEELKNHYYKRDNIDIVSIGNKLNSTDIDLDLKRDNDDTKNKKRFKYRYKFAIKLCLSLCILGSVVGYKYFPEEIKNSKAITFIKQEYQKMYSKNEVIENVEEYAKNIYEKVEKYIPEELYTNVVNGYIYKVKPTLINFSVDQLVNNKTIDNAVTVFNETDFSIDNTDMALAEEAITTSSELSLMSMDVEEILSKNINIALPVQGTVTSIYGAREEVFKYVGYHTGIDIANSLNTPIKSATDGVVVKAESMDKYYGNNIEIEKNGVIFKYAHLNQIDVKEGDTISQGQIIGLMGSTGASTGSHLHFEIKINDRSVDPEVLVKIR